MPSVLDGSEHGCKGSNYLSYHQNILKNKRIKKYKNKKRRYVKQASDASCRAFRDVGCFKCFSV